MIEQHVLSRLQKFIREAMNEGADHISMGGAKNFDEYQRMVGRIEGMALVERELIDLEQKLIGKEE